MMNKCIVFLVMIGLLINSCTLIPAIQQEATIAPETQVSDIPTVLPTAINQYVTTQPPTTAIITPAPSGTTQFIPGMEVQIAAQVGVMTGFDHVWDIAGQGDTIMVTCATYVDSDIWIVDARNPSQPELVGHLKTPGMSTRVIADDNYFYLSANQGP